MMQIWFLSVFFNLVTGLMLVYAPELKQSGDEKEPFYNDGTLRFVLGLLTVLTGFLRLICASAGNWPFVGDLFPGIAGICGGLCFVLEYLYIIKSRFLPDFIVIIFIGKRRYTGFCCMIAGLLHFLFSAVNIL